MIALVLALAVHRADVLLSAGHQGRPASCVRFPKRACNLGARGEIAWTPVVVEEAARVLRAHGVSVIAEPADFRGRFNVDAAVFVHFDGAARPCASAASIGYHTARDRAAARLWRQMYGSYFPFGFEPDNFTVGLRDYYAFRQVSARYGALVLELGEITCPRQRAWLARRLRFEGDAIAYFVSRLIGKGDVPAPANR